MTALLLLSALTLSWWLGVLQMLLAAWPVAGAIAFVLVRLQSGRTPLFWADVALETLIDMAADAPTTFAARFGQRAREDRA